MRKNRPLQNDVSLHIYTYSLLDLVQQLTDLTAPSFHLIKVDLFLYSISRVLSPNQAFSSSLTFSQFSSVAQSCLTLCDPMNHSTPGLPVYHQLPEFTQTHVHRISDAIQPSHPLSSPSPPAPNPSQHQSLFQ